MRTSRLALMVVVLASLPSAGDSFVPSASDLYLMNQVASFQLLAKGFEPFVGPSDGYEKSYLRFVFRSGTTQTKICKPCRASWNSSTRTGLWSIHEGCDDVSVIKSHVTVIRDLRWWSIGTTTKTLNFGMCK